jgi:hypothetical protein
MPKALQKTKRSARCEYFESRDLRAVVSWMGDYPQHPLCLPFS